MDELPIGGGAGASGGMGGPPPAQEDFSKMSIEERLASKVGVAARCSVQMKCLTSTLTA